jgi:hypothetical protein
MMVVIPPAVVLMMAATPLVVVLSQSPSPSHRHGAALQCRNIGSVKPSVGHGKISTE